MLAEEEFANNIQAPLLEKVLVSVDRSIAFRRFYDEAPNGEPVWHYHPEVELVFIKSGNGKRQVGNHISYYTSGDLLMLGPNLPHYGFTDRLTKKNTEVVLQFLPSFIPNIATVPEFKHITELLERSKHGLSFKGKTKDSIGKLLDEMTIMSPFERYLKTIEVLQILATSDEYSILNANQVVIKANKQERVRIKEIYDYVRAHFQEEISIKEVAQLISMTEPSFCRYFKKQTGSTFTKFVNEFRVIHACKLLSETGRTIADICFDCGFNNFSHFNKQFKIITEKSPSDYRNEFREVISSDY